MAGIRVALGIGTRAGPLIDKNMVELQEGDFILWNPDDDSWLDLIVSHHGVLMSAYELSGGEMKLKNWLYGSSNPCLKVGNIHPSCVEISGY